MISPLKSKWGNAESELREVVEGIVTSTRNKFHIYTIHRLVSLCLLNNYEYKYLHAYEPNEVRFMIILGEDKHVCFAIDIDSQYCTIENTKSMQHLESLLVEAESKKWHIGKSLFSFNK